MSHLILSAAWFVISTIGAIGLQWSDNFYFNIFLSILQVSIVWFGHFIVVIGNQIFSTLNR